jgi:hypothetical protein
MKTYNEILATEYSEEFNKLCKDSMVMSYYKYGPVALNYPDNVDAIKTIEERLALFKQDGNIAHLVDVANQAMIEFKHPRHPKAHYKGKDSGPRLHGMSVKEMEDFQQEHY